MHKNIKSEISTDRQQVQFTNFYYIYVFGCASVFDCKSETV